MKIYSEKFRYAAWDTISHVIDHLETAKSMFQNEMPIVAGTDLFRWVTRIAECVKLLDLLQQGVMKYHFNEAQEAKGYMAIQPGTQQWMEYWKANPAEQREMIEWQQMQQGSSLR